MDDGEPEAIDLESLMPRWRRPSLIQARKADPIRDSTPSPRLTFDEGLVGPLAGRERRVIRYRVVRLLDTAGLATPTDPIEAEGMKRSRRAVDESDIGQIKEGQAIRFSVQAYAAQKFPGAVKQVRLQSTTIDNVVNYTVVVAVDNAQGKLLPGMVGTAQFDYRPDGK